LPSYYARSADTPCIFCYEVTERPTAEMLYMSQQWDFFYCYRCRGWFKRHYENYKVVLPIRDRRDIRHLTWTYLSRMQRLERNAEFERRVRDVWRAFGKHLSRQ